MSGPPRRRPPRGPSPRPGSGLLGARAVEQLQQVVRRQLHVLVAPLGRAVDAGDQPGAVDAAEIAVHEGVAGLRLLRRPLGEAEVPFGVLVPGVGLQEGVLLAGAGLDGAPVASEDVLVGRDQAPGAADAAIAPGSFRVAPSPRRPSGSPCRLARCGSGDAVRLSRRPVDPYVNASASDRAASGWHRGAWIEQELAHALTRWWRAHPGWGAGGRHDRPPPGSGERLDRGRLIGGRAGHRVGLWFSKTPLLGLAGVVVADDARLEARQGHGVLPGFGDAHDLRG